MSARSLILGLDGADLELVLTLGAERLPHLFALMQRGLFAHQESVLPPATLPNWTTFLTGVSPGHHGVFDFTTRHGYAVRFTAGTVRAAPTWIARLDRLGMRCACIGFPATWPPERLQHGVFISGWDAPVAFEADRSFVWPRDVHDLLQQRFGPLRFDEVDQFRADQEGWHDALGTRLVDKIARRTELASFLLAMRRWDAFAFYFGESDTASHYLYSLYDEASPRRPEHVSEASRSGLVRVYEALDRAVGRLVSEAGGDVEITIVSDHGSGGASDRVFYLNQALAELGFLQFRAPKSSAKLSAKLKQIGLHQLSPKLRDRAFRAFSAALPSWLESRARFGAIEMKQTRAFSDELNYFPAVYLNQRGREPRGVVRQSERERTLKDVSAALLSLRDPSTKRAIVSKVHRREALFAGPHVARAPDLLLELNLVRGYSYNLMPSPGQLGAPLVRALAPEEYLGKKGRSLPGSHRPRGLLIAAGPQVAALGQVEASIEDSSALVLARLGVARPQHSRGKLPVGALLGAGREQPLPDVERSASAMGDVSRLEARLRALGYVD